jgi:ABC-type polysaccharide/polyol phosphate transport system ATPase subunit
MTKTDPILAARGVVLDLPWRLRLRRGSSRAKRVIDDVSFEIRPGEVVALLGRNGAGKSTLMRVMAGVYRPTAGAVVMAPGTQAAMLGLHMGFHQALTGRENARMVGLLMRVGRTRIRQALSGMADSSGLGEAFDMPMFTYSVGMQARLAFAAARMGSPALLLVDEVLSVGDADFRARCRDDLLAMAEAGGAVAIVSHDMATIVEMATRVIVLDGGRIAFDGGVAAGIDVYEGRAPA